MKTKKYFTSRNVLQLSILIIILCNSIVRSQQNFPQQIVDRISFEASFSKNKFHSQHAIQSPVTDGKLFSYPFSLSLIDQSRQRNFSFQPSAADIIVGPGRDTMVIKTNTTQRGSIFVIGYGVLIVDGAMLSIAGHIGASGLGKVYFRNGARLHFDQQFVAQYYVFLTDYALFEATDATVDANSVMHFIELHKNSTYIAKRTLFPDWTFRKMFDRSSLILEDIKHCGDLMIGDSSFVQYTRCDTLMPWFPNPSGSFFSIQFPDPNFVAHFELSKNTPGVNGINYSVIIDSCRQCWWSLESFPQSNVTIRNSTIRGCALRIPGNDSMFVKGISNYQLHANLTVPLTDRQLKFENTYITWWNWYPMDKTIFRMDSCLFSEMIGKGKSVTYATSSIHDGMTIMLGAIDTALVVYANGVSQAFVSSWDYSTLLLINSIVQPLRPYQSTNIAHKHSNMLCVNSKFVSLPFAMDTALVMFAAIDEIPPTQVSATITVRGSAWIHAGPFNPTKFKYYRLYWSPLFTSDWKLIRNSFLPISDTTLGVWSTSGLTSGNYLLRLTLFDDAGDSLTAYRGVALFNPTNVSDEVMIQPKEIFLENYPNPFSESTTIRFDIQLTIQQDGNLQPKSHIPNLTDHIFLKVFDILGREVATLVDGIFDAGQHSIEWNATGLKSGMYFYRLTSGQLTQTRKAILMR